MKRRNNLGVREVILKILQVFFRKNNIQPLKIWDLLPLRHFTMKSSWRLKKIYDIHFPVCNVFPREIPYIWNIKCCFRNPVFMILEWWREKRDIQRTAAILFLLLQKKGIEDWLRLFLKIKVPIIISIRVPCWILASKERKSSLWRIRKDF